MSALQAKYWSSVLDFCLWRSNLRGLHRCHGLKDNLNGTFRTSGSSSSPVTPFKCACLKTQMYSFRTHTHTQTPHTHTHHTHNTPHTHPTIHITHTTHTHTTSHTTHKHTDNLTSLAPHERLPEILVVPREKTPTGAEIDVFRELSCFFNDPAYVGNLISGSSAFSE